MSGPVHCAHHLAKQDARANKVKTKLVINSEDYVKNKDKHDHCLKLLLFHTLDLYL